MMMMVMMVVVMMIIHDGPTLQEEVQQDRDCRELCLLASMRRPLPSGRSSQTYVGRIVVELALSLVEPERRHIITSCHPVIMLFCHQVRMSLCHHIFMIISRGPLVVFVMDVGQSPLLWRSLHLRDESIHSTYYKICAFVFSFCGEYDKKDKRLREGRLPCNLFVKKDN